MHPILLINFQIVRHEIILNRGVSLHNISSLSLNVQVPNFSVDSGGTLNKVEDVRAILEGSIGRRRGG